MHCPEWQELLEDHLDGSLSGPDELDFTTHRENCPACAARYRERRQLGETVRTGLQKLSREIRFRPRPEAGRSILLRPRYLLPTAALLLLAVVIFFPGKTQESAPKEAKAVVELELVRTMVGEDEIFISGQSQGREYLIDIRVTSCFNNNAN